jgi:hypothetical protein
MVAIGVIRGSLAGVEGKYACQISVKFLDGGGSSAENMALSCRVLIGGFPGKEESPS